MLIMLLLGVWLVLGLYAFWYLFKAKTTQPMTLDDLALSWRIHKQRNACKAPRIQSLITKGEEAIGFRCECGYMFKQKRLISQKPIIQQATPQTICQSLQSVTRNSQPR